jgi:hypothetical protein
MLQLIMYWITIMIFVNLFYLINTNTFIPNQIVNTPYYFGTRKYLI